MTCWTASGADRESLKITRDLGLRLLKLDLMQPRFSSIAKSSVRMAKSVVVFDVTFPKERGILGTTIKNGNLCIFVFTLTDVKRVVACFAHRAKNLAFGNASTAPAKRNAASLVLHAK